MSISITEYIHYCVSSSIATLTKIKSSSSFQVTKKPRQFTSLIKSMNSYALSIETYIDYATRKLSYPKSQKRIINLDFEYHCTIQLYLSPKSKQSTLLAIIINPNSVFGFTQRYVSPAVHNLNSIPFVTIVYLFIQRGISEITNIFFFNSTK